MRQDISQEILKKEFSQGVLKKDVSQDLKIEFTANNEWAEKPSNLSKLMKQVKSFTKD
jgi:hypothetical protein